MAATISTRLAELGLELPKAPKPVASYIPARIESGVVYVSGQIPMRDGEPMALGSVPIEVSLEDAVLCARQCALNAVACAAEAAGSVDRLAGVIRVGCFVACGPGFAEHPQVANGASEILAEIFGEAGRHARAAVGCSSLPLGVPVEAEVMFRLAD
jgi:enamine deaminase RidA (YjgF/YER057c/UK114 family)